MARSWQVVPPTITIRNWSNHSDHYYAHGVAVAVSNKLTPMIIEVTPVNEHIMRL